MLTIDYINTQPYRLGRLYKELGELLMNPATTMQQLTDAATFFNCNINFALEALSPTLEASDGTDSTGRVEDPGTLG